MSANQTQDIMKVATTLINGEYKTPGKLLLWAMAWPMDGYYFFWRHFPRRFAVYFAFCYSFSRRRLPKKCRQHEK